MSVSSKKHSKTIMLKVGRGRGVEGPSGRLALGSFAPTALTSNEVGEVGRPFLFCGGEYHVSKIQGKREGVSTSI